jgi:hypothetical protein
MNRLWCALTLALPALVCSQTPCPFNGLDFPTGMRRLKVEEVIAQRLQKINTYSPYGNNLRGGMVAYQSENCTLNITYKAGTPAPWVRGAGSAPAVHYPPVDESVQSHVLFVNNVIK